MTRGYEYYDGWNDARKDIEIEKQKSYDKGFDDGYNTCARNQLDWHGVTESFKPITVTYSTETGVSDGD